MFDPCESSSMIASAIFSQKNNPKYEYLRALIHLLTEVHGFEMDSPVIRKAILLTATVVIDIEVSDKDVNNAWEQLVRKSKEDSCKNSR